MMFNEKSFTSTTSQNLNTNATNAKTSINDIFSNIYSLKDNTFQNNLYHLIMIISDLGMMIGPSLVFIIQILKIEKQKSSNGISNKITLILILSNIIRVIFWLGSKFSKVLLFQSILMIFVQFYLLYTWLKYNDKDRLNSGVEYDIFNTKSSNYFMDMIRDMLDFNKFWNWARFIDYLVCVFMITLSIVVITIFKGLNDSIYFEFLGFIAACIESIIGIPQLIMNYNHSSTGSLSYGMILSWLAGDLFKSIYFYINKSPWQLFVCSIFQINVDILLVLQFVIYNSNKEVKYKNKELKYEYRFGYNSKNIDEEDEDKSSLIVNMNTIYVDPNDKNISSSTVEDLNNSNNYNHTNNNNISIVMEEFKDTEEKLEMKRKL